MVKSKRVTSYFSDTFNLCSTSRFTVLVTSLIVLTICGVRQLGSLEFLELAEYDLMMRSRGETEPDERITIVGINELDIKTWRQSTFSDRLIAQLLEKLQQHQPAVIGLDIYRDVPQPPGNQELRSQLAAENIIAIEKVGRKERVAAPPNLPPERIGFNNFVVDHDGKIRRNFMSFQTKKGSLYSFALQISKSYLNAKSLEVMPGLLTLEHTNFPSLKADAGGYQLSPSDVWGSQILLDYRSPDKVAGQLSFSQIIKGDFDPDWIKDKIVIIGYTAPSKKDIFSTPFEVGRMPGVIIHAHMVSQILSTVLNQKPLLRFLPDWSEYTWIWLWSIAGAVLVWRTKHPLALGGGLIALLISLSGICWLSFINALWIPATPGIIGLLATTGVVLAYKTFYSSNIDELTGLANQNQIITLLQQTIAKAKYSEVAILSINIARFRTINDSLSRAVGDRLLILASQRIQNSIRPHDKLARVGIAEFSLILFPLKNQDYAIEIAKRIQLELAQAFNIKGQEIIIATDLGIAFHAPGEKIQAEELLRNSNLAQERARVLGKNKYAVFVPRMHSETLAQWQLESDLRHAVEQQEFELYYQPIVNLHTEQIAGFEALVRWISPSRGFVSPGEFIPLSETTGLIIPLGDWILREGCRQMYHWQQQFNFQPLTISINLSSHQFQADLVLQISAILAETQLPPQCLKLEITESAVMKNVEEAIALLHQLKALGIKISIDDFGTGYSSLSYLQQFCADTLKVDQSFVHRVESSLTNQAIVDIIVTLAHKLDMDVIAEGIETKNHQAILKALNCEYGQGYLFSKPLKSEAATELLAQQFLVNAPSHS